MENKNWAPEIYAIGMRNPWRFSFDRETGLLYAADVGEDLWEEIDIIQKGGNYGWSVREGRHDFKPANPMPKTIDPIFEYNHHGTSASITGGYVYHGQKIPELRGWYIFGDYSQGMIWAIKYENGKVVSSGVLVDLRDPSRNGGPKSIQPSSFGEDADGELYMVDNTLGWCYRIVPGK